jgi:integrase
LIVARWYYKCDPILPEFDNAGRRFHKRQIYYDLSKLVKENPGLTGGQIALKLGRPVSQVTPFLWNLRKYCNALEVERTGFIRTPGLEEFLQISCVKKMLLKLGSKKTRAAWGRKLFKYQKWLASKKIFPDVEAMLDDFKNAKNEDGKYRHLDIMQEYLNSWKGDIETKDSVQTIIRGFYRKNRAELPREKIIYDREMLTKTVTEQSFVKPGEIWKIIEDGHVPVRDKAIIATLLTLGADESTVSDSFNYYGYPQIVRALGKDYANWDLSRAPLRIDLRRSKTQYNYYSFLPKKTLEFIRSWLNIRRDMVGQDIRIFIEDGVEKSDPVFITYQRKPINEQGIGDIVRESSFKSGVQKRVPGTRYRIHGHEFRDTFKTTGKVAGVDTAVCEFLIGHSIDDLKYDKSPWAYPEHFRSQYLLLEPYICGEEKRLALEKESQKDVHNRLSALEVSLLELNTRLSDLSARLSQPGQSPPGRIEGSVSNANGHFQKKPVKPEELDALLAEGWDPVMNLPDGRVLVSKPIANE